jgi:rubredoxin
LLIVPNRVDPRLFLFRGPVFAAVLFALHADTWAKFRELPCPKCGKAFSMGWFGPRARCSSCGFVFSTLKPEA